MAGHCIHQHLAQSPMTWHLSWPLVQLSKAQRMGLFSLLFSKDQGWEALGQGGLFPWKYDGKE